MKGQRAFPNRILFVGEQSGGTMRAPAFGFPVGAAKRLAGMLGISHEEMLERYEFINLLAPGTWSQIEAKRAGKVLLDDIDRRVYSKVVLLGRKIQMAVFPHSVDGASLVEVVDFLRVPVLFFPHPSGRNRLFNDPKFKVKAVRALRRFAS